MYKNDFPYFQNNSTIYLDNAATTQKPKCVIDSQVEYYSKYCANIHRSSFDDANKATLEFENAREIIKDFINANKKDEIIFTKGVTEGINFIASSYARKFKTIIISSLEHHANVVPWHLQGRTIGKGLEVVSCDENLEFNFEHFEEILTKNPNSFVSIIHISNAFGKIHNIKKIISLAHKYNSVVSIDGAQSLLHEKINVQDLDVDFFVISGHKTLAPTGVGAIYIKQKHLKDIEIYQGGGGMIRHVSFEKSTFLPSPLGFEAGTQNIAGVIGFGEAIKYINKIGLENIKAENEKLFNYLHEKLSQFEDIIFYTNTKNTTGNISFNFKNISHDDIGILLSKQKIAVRVGHHCASPIMQELGIKGTIRTSTAFYNDLKDIDNFIKALTKTLSILKG